MTYSTPFDRLNSVVSIAASSADPVATMTQNPTDSSDIGKARRFVYSLQGGKHKRSTFTARTHLRANSHGPILKSMDRSPPRSITMRGPMVKARLLLHEALS